MYGKKDISKLVPMKVVDKLGRIMTVYVRPEEFERQKYSKKFKTKEMNMQTKSDEFKVSMPLVYEIKKVKFELDNPAEETGYIQIWDDLSGRYLWTGIIYAGEKKATGILNEVSKEATLVKPTEKARNLIVKTSPHLIGGKLSIKYAFKE
jgi:hypothetical protein